MPGPGSTGGQGDLFGAVPRAAPDSQPAPAPAPAPEPAPETEAGPTVVTVVQLTRAIARSMKGFGRVAVEGEVSGLKRAGSGHVYFGLKEENALLSCAIWKSRVRGALSHDIQEGERVVCHGALDVYAPRGSYSLIVDRVERRGIGALLARLEALKADLKQRGWFDRRRPLPKLPACIGVVTSRDSAGFQDFLRTRSLRWPLYPVRLAHTPVQGAVAAREIAAAIRSLDASGVPLIVLLRGGGSLEDLWCFNELAVAEAIWECRAPVVTGVGHETDVTLADLVADHRAHTPTDAAQAVIPERAALEEQLERLFGYLGEALHRNLLAREERLDRAARSRTLRSADWLLADRVEALGRLQRRLFLAGARWFERTGARAAALATRLARQSPAARLARLETRLAAVGPRLTAAPEGLLAERERQLGLAQRALETTSPFAVLERGYSITRRVDDGRAVRSAREIKAGETVETLLSSGALVSKVTEAREKREGEGGA